MENTETPRNALTPGYQLLWYEIRSVLGQGAFGITYLARDTNLKRLVAIKEFLPGQYAMRDQDETIRPVTDEMEERFSEGLRRFIQEARILDQFEHPNIVRITNVFEANNTAYMVMRYEQGVSLKEILIRQKFLDEADLLNILFPILNGLEKIHESGFIHRDIKPANIFIRTDGTPVLLDFGSARQSLEKETHTLTSLVSPGYAPIEQYVSKSDKQGPWSDIYGMAATLYRAVTGVPPCDAITRGESLTRDDRDNLIPCHELADKRYSDRFLAAIDHGLAFLTRDRPQTIGEWKEELQPQTQTGEAAKTVLSGHASGQVVSLVKESLTETVTRLNDSLDPSWNKEAFVSMELAHKQGFRRGIKYALALLLLIAGGLFIGNYQKIQQVVQPGFVAPDEISNRPIQSVTGMIEKKKLKEELKQELKAELDNSNEPATPLEIAKSEKVKEKLKEEIKQELKAEISNGDQLVVSPDVVKKEEIKQELKEELKRELSNEQTLEKADALLESNDLPEPKMPETEIPVVLDEKTAKKLEAEGKIIVIDEEASRRITKKKKVEQHPVEALKGEEIPFRKLPVEKKTPVKTVTPEIMPEPAVTSPVVPSDNTVKTEQSVKRSGEATTERRVQEVYVPAKKQKVIIEEIKVPPHTTSPDDNVVEKLRDWVDFMVKSGKERAKQQPQQNKEQTGSQLLENK